MSIYPKRQLGQTLVLMTGVLLLISLLLFAVTDMGKHARRQWYLQSVADNASYSAAVAMSRQMNFMALTNRALIGNQVAIAQWVGLASYLSMLDRTADNLELITSFIPYLGQITRAISTIVDRIEESFARVAKLLVAFQAAVIQGISKAQYLLDAGFTAELPILVDDIVKKHSQDLEWDAYQGGGAFSFPILWFRRVTFKSTKDKKDSELFEKLTVKSLDPFSESRSYNWVDLFSLKVVKRGGTELSRDKNGGWDWNSIDSVSLHNRRWIIGGFREFVPMGWGATAQNRKRYNDDFKYGGAFQSNPVSSQLAVGALSSFNVKQNYFKYAKMRRFLSSSADRVIVKVTQGDQVAYGKAMTRFNRPTRVFPRSDELIENENLFNALWEAHLKPLNLKEKGVLLARDFT